MGTRMNKSSPGAGIWACRSSTPSALRHSWDAADARGTTGGRGGGRASRDRAVSEVLRDLTEADEASTHTPDGLCCPPLMTTPDGPSPTGFRLETADSKGERPRMELGSGWDTDVHRRQVPQDRHHPCGAPSPNSGGLRRGSAPWTFLGRTPGGQPPLTAGLPRLDESGQHAKSQQVAEELPELLCRPLLQEGRAVPSDKPEMGVKRFTVREGGG